MIPSCSDGRMMNSIEQSMVGQKRIAVTCISSRLWTYRMLQHAKSVKRTPHSNTMYSFAQCVTTHTEKFDHISSRELAWLKIWKIKGCTSLCPKTIVIHVLCLIPS